MTLEARTSFDPTWLGVVWPTAEAKERDTIEDLKAGRDAAKRRDEEVRRAAIVATHAIRSRMENLIVGLSN